MLLIRNIESRRIDVKRVRVFHDELAHAQQSRLRTRFVAELRLNLIPNLRQLLVAAQFLARDVGHDLFVGHAETEIRAFAILEAKHVLAHHAPAPACLPNLSRIQCRQIKFLADLVHFFADDAHDLLGRAIAQEEEGIDSGAELTNVSGADEEFVACDFGVCGSLAESRDEELRPTMHEFGFQSSRKFERESFL